MKIKNLLFVCISMFFAVLSPAFAHEVTILGGVNFSGLNTNESTLSQYLGSLKRFNFGLDYNIGFAPLVVFEVGAFYQVRGFSVSASSGVGAGEASISAKSITVPVLVRFSVVPKFLSLGAGLYGSYALDDLYVDGRLNIPGIVNLSGGTSISHQSLGLTRFDYGLVTSMKGTIPVAPGIDLVGDLRYQLGLKDQNDSITISSKLRDFIVLLGARFAI